MGTDKTGRRSFCCTFSTLAEGKSESYFLAHKGNQWKVSTRVYNSRRCVYIFCQGSIREQQHLSLFLSLFLSFFLSFSLSLTLLLSLSSLHKIHSWKNRFCLRGKTELRERKKFCLALPAAGRQEKGTKKSPLKVHPPTLLGGFTLALAQALFPSCAHAKCLNFGLAKSNAGGTKMVKSKSSFAESVKKVT